MAYADEFVNSLPTGDGYYKNIKFGIIDLFGNQVTQTIFSSIKYVCCVKLLYSLSSLTLLIYSNLLICVLVCSDI